MANPLWASNDPDEICGYTVPRIKQYTSGHKPHVASPITRDQQRAWLRVPKLRYRTTDVLVAGGGLGGVAAAVAAARRGLTVTLVEPTHLLGGQATAGGVSALDITFEYDRLLNDSGIWGEFLRRVLHIYDVELQRPVNVGHYRNSSITPNPSVIERVLTEMAEDAGIRVLRNTRITGAIVDRSVSLVRGLDTTAGPIRARMTVDATEDGQVLAVAGAAHRIGNVVRFAGEHPEASKSDPAIQDITYTAFIQAYPNGIPSNLRITSKPPGYQAYLPAFRKHFPPAGGKDPMKKKEGPLGFAGFRAAPDLGTANMAVGNQWPSTTRTNLNHINDFSVRASYLEDSAQRVRDEAAAIEKTLCLIYYLQNELGLPWSVSTDEGFADGPTRKLNPLVDPIFAPVVRHFPLIPYIRESRRCLGIKTLTGKDITRNPSRTIARWQTDSIATGTYHPDLHGGRTEADFEADLGESLADKPPAWRIGPFPIPLGCLIPETFDGLLAAEKNLSMSRIAAAASRLHPTVTATGEAAGVLAAISIRKGRPAREVPAAAVQYELGRGGALVAPLSIRGTDRSDPAFGAIALAVARQRVPFEISVGTGDEPEIIVDLRHAREAGFVSRSFFKEWIL